MNNRFSLTRSLKYIKVLLIENRLSIIIPIFILITITSMFVGTPYALEKGMDKLGDFLGLFSSSIKLFAIIAITTSTLKSYFKQGNASYRTTIPVSTLERFIAIIVVCVILPSIIIMLATGVSLVISHLIAGNSGGWIATQDQLLSYVNKDIQYSTDTTFIALATTLAYLDYKIGENKAKRGVQPSTAETLLIVGILLVAYSVITNYATTQEQDFPYMIITFLAIALSGVLYKLRSKFTKNVIIEFLIGIVALILYGVWKYHSEYIDSLVINFDVVRVIGSIMVIYYMYRLFKKIEAR